MHHIYAYTHTYIYIIYIYIVLYIHALYIMYICLMYIMYGIHVLLFVHINWYRKSIEVFLCGCKYHYRSIRIPILYVLILIKYSLTRLSYNWQVFYFLSFSGIVARILVLFASITRLPPLDYILRLLQSFLVYLL